MSGQATPVHPQQPNTDFIPSIEHVTVLDKTSKNSVLSWFDLYMASCARRHFMLYLEAQKKSRNRVGDATRLHEGTVG
jgi:hypothetical protein